MLKKKKMKKKKKTSKRRECIASAQAQHANRSALTNRMSEGGQEGLWTSVGKEIREKA